MAHQDRYYLLKIYTNAPEHKLDRVDAAAARNLHHGFGSQAELYVYEGDLPADIFEYTRRVLYDPVVDDGEEPPGYVPVYEKPLPGNDVNPDRMQFP